MFLYRLGAGGRVTRLGAVLISLVTVVTVFLAFFGGLVLDALSGYSQATGQGQVDALYTSRFWDIFFEVLKEPEVLSDYTGNAALAALATLAGIVLALRSAFAPAPEPAPASAVGVPAAPDAVTGQPPAAPYSTPSTGVAAETPPESDAPRA